MKKMSRDQDWSLLQKYVDDPSLLEHSLVVETIMRYYARLNNEDPDVWGVTGLLHDLDWQKFPEKQHCFKTAEILRAHAVDEFYIHAIMSHDCHCTGVFPKTLLEKNCMLSTNSVVLFLPISGSALLKVFSTSKLNQLKRSLNHLLLREESTVMRLLKGLHG